MAGTYSATIVATALRTSNTGKDCVSLQFKTIADLGTGDPCEKTVFGSLWLTDKAGTRTVQTLREIGWLGTTFEELNGKNPLWGREVEISTSEEEYNGKVRERADFVHAKGNYAERGVRPCPPREAKAIARRCDSLLGGDSDPEADDLPF